MCGIVGYIGQGQDAQQVILDALRRLEYRGYDSAGVAIFESGQIAIRRAVGKLGNLESALRDRPISGRVGVGHTRWATHGKPSERNAHPHKAGSVVVVHNGIMENYRELRAELEVNGHAIASDTDTELIAHLIDARLRAGSDLVTAVREACARVVGSYAFGVLSETDPEHIVVAKHGGSPIVLGIGEKQNYIASDIPAILPYTRQMLFLEDGEFAVVSEDAVQVLDRDGRPIDRDPRAIQWDPVSAEKGGYDRFMQKEIFEQPRAITDTIGTRVLENEGDIDLNGIDLSPERVAGVDRIALVACGTAWHACLVGKYMIEQLAGIPCDVDLASEFRYRKPILGKRVLVIPVSQSGETADTLAALREGRRQGSRVLAVCNVRDATIARESHDVLYTHAGPEIGVASTKAFTTQVVALYMLAIRLAVAKGVLGADARRARLADLLRLPRLVQTVLEVDESVRAIAQKYMHANDFLYLGRGVMVPIAFEGALKLKEISYIHAEAYAAGEMKHGPIALIDEKMPVVVIATKCPTYDKVISNLEQVRARDGMVIAIASEGDDSIGAKANDVIYVPDLGEYLTAVLVTVPLQLLAYHVALLKGTDVDQPRNLAKSVTVE
jgi:glucosamine--fructose-6-phosphate aminotransferase (isomerizing)